MALLPMIKQIANVEIAITHTEAEALLLESNQVKQHAPLQYPFKRRQRLSVYLPINLTKVYPRLQFYRGSRQAAGQYFGPYASSGAVSQTLHLMKKLFKVRQCEDSQFANRSRPCLEYQIKRCSAPCELD